MSQWFRVYFNVEVNRQVDVQFITGSALGGDFWIEDPSDDYAQLVAERWLRRQVLADIIADHTGSAGRGFTELEVGPVVRLKSDLTPDTTPTDGPTDVRADDVRETR